MRRTNDKIGDDDMNKFTDMLNGKPVEKVRFCWSCGAPAAKGEAKCPGCGAEYESAGRFGSTDPAGLGGVGWSDAFSDISLKKNDRTGGIFTLVFMLAVLAVIFIVMLTSGDISLDSGGMKIFGAIAVVMIAFWGVWALASSGGKMKKDWEGTVVDKSERMRNKSDGQSDMEFILHVELDGGKKKKAVIKNDNMFYDYLGVGDRVRWHGRGRDYYEKYDKSKDYVIPCVQCRIMRDIRENYCPLCGTKLPKAEPVDASAGQEPVKAEPVRQPSVSSGYCVSCGEKLKPGAKFCENCGKKVGG